MIKFKPGILFLACLLAAACTSSRGEKQIEAQLASMTLREKVGQMFIIRPEALDPGLNYHTTEELAQIRLQELSDSMLTLAVRYPVGGVILFAHNIGDREQLGRLVSDLCTIDPGLLLCIDEEGGRVVRIASNPAFGVPHCPPMSQLASSGKSSEVRDAAYTIGKYLKELGFDVDFAPVADVNTNPRNIVIGDRAFSSDPRKAAPMVKAYLRGLHKAGVAGCLKHFPGHGDTTADSHYGYAVSEKTWEEISSCEMIPFKAGIKEGVEMIMTAHISLPQVNGNSLPATLSRGILEGKLRGELHYDGVIITDAMEMGAITREYDPVQACIMAVQAGADILLCVKDYTMAVEAIEEAVESGDISIERIDASVKRILRMKQRIR